MILCLSPAMSQWMQPRTLFALVVAMVRFQPRKRARFDICTDCRMALVGHKLYKCISSYILIYTYIYLIYYKHISHQLQYRSLSTPNPTSKQLSQFQILTLTVKAKSYQKKKGKLN